VQRLPCLAEGQIRASGIPKPLSREVHKAVFHTYTLRFTPPARVFRFHDLTSLLFSTADGLPPHLPCGCPCLRTKRTICTHVAKRVCNILRLELPDITSIRCSRNPTQLSAGLLTIFAHAHGILCNPAFDSISSDDVKWDLKLESQMMSTSGIATLEIERRRATAK